MNGGGFRCGTGLHSRNRHPFKAPLARGLAGLLWLGVFTLAWPELAIEAKVADDLYQPLLLIILAIRVLASLYSLFIAWAIWRGSNVARVLVMFGVTISTTTAAIGCFTNGDTITINTTLLTVALDILVLLALSSRDTLAWARSPRKKWSRS